MAYAYHDNRTRYFEHQYRVTAEYVIPFIEQSGPLSEPARVLEIGCGEGGVLKAFLDRGAEAVGVDISAVRLNRAKEFLSEPMRDGRLMLLHQDAHTLVDDDRFRGAFDLIVMKDVIEHMENRPQLFAEMRTLLRSNGRVFLAFPPWRMPFGGHQQICRSRILSRAPYLHLLPIPAYERVLTAFGETPSRVKSLLDTKRTGISTQAFEDLVAQSSYRVLSHRFYLLNPMYSYRFGMSPRVQKVVISAQPRLRDFVTTCAYYCVAPSGQP